MVYVKREKEYILLVLTKVFKDVVFRDPEEKQDDLFNNNKLEFRY